MTQTIDHEHAFELLPWLANGTLSEVEQQRVERHLSECLTCRAELKEQRALRALVRRHPDVHLSPEQGFARLRGRLEGREARPGGFFLDRPLFRPKYAAAAALALAVAGGLAWLATPGPQTGLSPEYRTLADSDVAARPGRLRLDIIFAPGTSEEEMRALLAELDARIVGGPSRLGRYTIELDSGESQDSAALVQRLLRDDRVRFAGPQFTPIGAAEGRTGGGAAQ